MIIEVKSLSKSFSQGSRQIQALDNISFSLAAEDSMAIVGPSGSGKSTLLSILAGLDQADQGEIFVAGQAIHKMTEKELTDFRSHHIGIVFQQFYLMPHLTALENVCLPLEIIGETNVHEKAKTLLQQVGLESRMDHKPNQLSGGECQRVAIARASVTRPPILLADEPSGNLDTETGHVVMDLLFKLAAANKMTLVLITHDRQLAQRCQQQIHLVGGKLQ